MKKKSSVNRTELSISYSNVRNDCRDLLGGMDAFGRKGNNQCDVRATFGVGGNRKIKSWRLETLAFKLLPFGLQLISTTAEFMRLR